MNAFPELSSFGALTPWGLLLLVIATVYFALSRGTILTKNQHLESLKAQQQVTDIYKESATKWEAVATNSVEQNGKLIESNSIIDDFFKKADRTGAATPNQGHNGTVEGGQHVGS